MNLTFSGNANRDDQLILRIVRINYIV
jgi:hypothetical protein